MTLKRLTFLNLLVQAAIIVTGVSVRVTGSGLGCPTWPQCVPGSYTPTVEQAQAWHKYVEFGNRTLTFVLTAVAIATFVQVWRLLPHDRGARTLAAVPFLGTFAQALLGGVTVLTGLNPVTVMAHFLVSVAIIAASHALWVRVTGTPHIAVREVLLLDTATKLLVGVAAGVILLGTIVTGSGPHSGDAEKPARFGFDPQLTSWIHADFVWLMAGLAVGLWAYARWSLGNIELERRTRRVVELIVAQGAVGYLQYWTGLPWYLVVLHAGMAAWFWIAVLHVRSAARVAQSA